MRRDYISFILIAAFANAQVSIGGKQSVEGTTTILDFNNVADNTKGIILPAIQNRSTALATNASQNNGTFFFEKDTNKVMMYEGEKWVELNSKEGSQNGLIINDSTELTENHGAIIGAETSAAKGVLILESADKAMILPKIANPHDTVKNPYPGMICYDTASDTLAVFDGLVWNYWK